MLFPGYGMRRSAFSRRCKRTTAKRSYHERSWRKKEQQARPATKDSHRQLFSAASLPLIAPALGFSGGGVGPSITSFSASSAASAIATTTTTAGNTIIASSGGGTTALKLLLAFTAGGLFFSTAIAAITACYAVGLDNVQRLLRILALILRKVWATFVFGLGATKAALLADGSWKWRDAWQVLKQQLTETRKAAAQGVKAIRAEANLYAAAVGAPGLIPIQYVLDRLMPFSIATALEDSLKESLVGMTSSGNSNSMMKKITLSGFTAGTKAPKLEAARVYDLGKNAIAFDCDIDWPSELDIKLTVFAVGGLARIPVTVTNVRFSGVLRVILTPLIDTQPGYGAALVSFPSNPKISLDVRVAGGEVTRVPWLRSEIMATIRQGVADELLWPRRVVVPSTAMGSKKAILPKSELDALEKSDPLLRAEQELKDRSLWNLVDVETKGDAEVEFNSSSSSDVAIEKTEHHRWLSSGIDRGKNHEDARVRRKKKSTIESGILINSLFSAVSLLSSRETGLKETG